MILILKLTLLVSSYQFPVTSQNDDWKPATGNWKLYASVPTHTALCDFVVGKNYRLQDIQLSKSLRSSFQLSTLSFQLVERRLRAELSPNSSGQVAEHLKLSPARQPAWP